MSKGKERIQESTTESILPFQTDNNVMMKICCTNMSCVNDTDPEQWLETNYTVYWDGKVERIDKYGAENKKTSTGKFGYMGVMDIQIIGQHLSSQMKSMKTDVMDGESWSFSYYEHGKEVQHVHGYIYENTVLKTLVEKLNKCCMQKQ